MHEANSHLAALGGRGRSFRHQQHTQLVEPCVELPHFEPVAQLGRATVDRVQKRPRRRGAALLSL